MRFRGLAKFQKQKASLGEKDLTGVWQRKNELYLKVIQLLKSKKGPKISIDYREEVVIDRQWDTLEVVPAGNLDDLACQPSRLIGS